MAANKYNETDKKQKQAAAKDLALKLSLEAGLLISLRGLFGELSGDFVKSVTATGAIPSVDDFRQELNRTLNDHYINVSSKFDQQVLDAIGTSEQLARVQQQIIQGNAIHAAIKAPKSAAQISQTSLGNMHEALQTTAIEAAQQGEILNNKQLADRSKLKVDQSFDAKSPVIAATETNNAAEQAKQHEINTIVTTSVVAAEILPTPITIPKKKWSAILDERTRLWHAEADGQVRDFDEPYIVNGELLMHPSDDSLGASPNNIINCRCSSTIIIG